MYKANCSDFYYNDFKIFKTLYKLNIRWYRTKTQFYEFLVVERRISLNMYCLKSLLEF